MPRMFSKWIVPLLLLCVVAGAGAFWRLAEDPRYLVSDWTSFGRYSRYDPLIEEAARKHGVDPLLVRAVVWQESRFHPDKTGGAGERGLMQVGEMAAADWVRIHKVETFAPTDLFSPSTNLEIGTWYLAQALRRWKERDDAVPFALAEYNAGKRRVDRWTTGEGGDGGPDGPLGARAFQERIDFPTTRAYVEAIVHRFNYYRRRAGER
ncbi:MAG TPA: lytic transglycosylase domain-containing protein [Chthoniobacteraceae bacterium]|nr:lytic transglycosylase domain-containing protein [Chthoniobacteraceae bacterium]